MFPVSRLVSESAAANLLQQVRWRDGVECPRCRSDLKVRNGGYREYQRYLCKNCGRTFNDKTGTIFAHSKLSLKSNPSVMVEGSDTGVEYRAPADLEPHSLNDEVYGDRDDLDEALVESIDEHGILEPIVADPQPEAGTSKTAPTILPGHRRVEAAKRVGLNQVPVRLVRLDTELERRERLLVHNQTREKTFSQKLREAAELERIERERAKQCQGTRTDIVENSPQGSDERSTAERDFGKTRQRVAEKVGFGSGRTYENAKTVWEAAQDGDTVAKHEIEKLDRGEQSVHGAYQKVRDRIRQDDDDDSTEGDEPSATAAPTSESSSPEEDDREQVSTEDVVLSAHVGTNDDVFPKILDLHVAAGASVVDVTYGEGAFWRQVPSGKYDLTATDIFTALLAGLLVLVPQSSREVPRGQAPRLPVSTTRFADSTRESTGSAVSAGVDSESPTPTWWRRQRV